MTQARVLIMSLSVSTHSPGSLHLTSIRSSTQQIHITIDGFYSAVINTSGFYACEILLSVFAHISISAEITMAEA